jgi:cbb3-type cytochrome oxidase subunit 3
MFKEVLQSIEGIEFYSIVSMLMLILFFIGIVIWLFKVDKKYIKHMSELPLNENNHEVSNFTGGTNERQ